MSKRGVVALVFMLAPISLVIGGCAVWKWTTATFTVKNESGQTIRYLRVEVYENEPYLFENIPPGGEVSGSFTVRHETTLMLHGQLADGTKFDESYGYAVWEEFAPHIGVVVQHGGLIGP
jgi:hypothetical protein